MSYILEGLFMGDADAVSTPEKLLALSVSHVLTIEQ
jgi:hypothetical protein